MTTRAYSRKSLFLCIYTNTARLNQVKGHFVHFLQTWKITKHSSSVFIEEVVVAS